MFKGIVENTTTVGANTNIPLTVVYNSNSNTAYSSSDDTVLVKKPGFYDIKGQFVLTDVAAGDVSIQLFADGEPIPEAVATGTSTGTTVFITLPLIDMERVLPTLSTGFAKLSVRPTIAVTIDSGTLIIERVR